MSINKQYRTDKSRETDGVTIEYADTDGNVEAWFLCRRPGGRNMDFQRALNKRLRKYREAIQEMDEEEQEDLLTKIYAEVYAETVILDWGGDIDGPDGTNPAECTHENIVWLFHEDCPDLFENLQMRLGRRNIWQPEDKEAARKNSETVSSTS